MGRDQRASVQGKAMHAGTTDTPQGWAETEGCHSVYTEHMFSISENDIAHSMKRGECMENENENFNTLQVRSGKTVFGENGVRGKNGVHDAETHGGSRGDQEGRPRHSTR